MSLNTLTAISPVDGRYNKTTRILQKYFSESALIKFRVHVEIEYFVALCNSEIIQLQEFPKEKFKILRQIYEDFNETDAANVKEIEKITNHDVKAVEYYIKNKFEKIGLGKFKEFIHFGLTSQDINNTAVPYSIKLAMNEVYLNEIKELIIILKEKSKKWEEIPLLSRTHGQAASPTRMGKEINVFIERLEKQLKLVQSIPFEAKFGGATGNFNAHHIAFPSINWRKFADNFTKESFDLNRQQTTTQIEHYDNIAALLDNLNRINTILIDFSRDIWTYISLDYFKQKIKKGEIGSSAMPHKVNPIDFENAEGNLGISIAISKFLSSKLPISRLQRDLTDSTVLRNIGIPFSHNLIAIKALKKGIDKLLINQVKISKDLEDNWAVVAEGIQTILRRENYPNAYEVLKELTRKNVTIDSNAIQNFIENLDVDNNVKEELSLITPSNYTGI